MNILRTPDECFKNLPDYPFMPNYVNVDDLRMHYVDEGADNKGIFLLMHGEPSWSYLYRHMIPILVDGGYRVIAPDLVGFGKSDKLDKMEDHSYQKHVDWMKQFVESLDLQNITLFCQDWGSLIGLRLVTQLEDRFSRICVGNGGLPSGRGKMPAAFNQWVEHVKTTPTLKIGRTIQMGTVSRISKEIRNAYDAPFPSDEYKAGARIFPSLVPTSSEDPESIENEKAWKILKQWKKPFLTAFSDGDPITHGGERVFQKLIPGAQGQPHTTIKGAGHFLQEEKGPEIANLLLEFCKNS
jgi:haloalkane dehalogenase